MPRARAAHGAVSSNRFADSFYYFEDTQNHSHLYAQPRHIPEYADYTGYEMADEEHYQEEEQTPTTNEDWETSLRSFNVTGPRSLAAKGVTLNPGMVITIQSRGPTKRAALFSHASVRPLRVHDNAEVMNGGRSVTGVKVAQSGSTVTMEYRFDDLQIEEAGEFYYDLCIYGMDTLTSMAPKILVMWGEKRSGVVTITE
jgi:hypothetical protein